MPLLLRCVAYRLAAAVVVVDAAVASAAAVVVVVGNGRRAARVAGNQSCNYRRTRPIEAEIYAAVVACKRQHRQQRPLGALATPCCPAAFPSCCYCCWWSQTSSLATRIVSL